MPALSLSPVRLARCAVCTVVIGLFPGLVASTHALDLAVSPAAIGWSSNTWVTCTVSNIPVGSAVTLELYHDLDTNGIPGGPDRLIRSFALQDGVTNTLGSRVIPDDDDGSDDGVITTRIPYFGTGGPTPLWRSVGHYAWRASTIASGEDTAAFTVSQPTSSTWITGEVLDYPGSNAVAGAVVGIDAFAEHAGPLPTVLTDTNGRFSIYLPAHYPTGNVAGVWAVAAGAMMADEGPDGSTFSGAPLLSDPSAGANVLPNPLLVVDGHDLGAFDIHLFGGHVYDSATNPLAGAWVEAEPDEDSDLWAIAVTDTNGFFELPMLAGDLSFFTVDMVENQRGLVPAWSERSLSGPVSDIEIFCPAADVLARVAVREAGSADPVPGAFVVFESESCWNSDMALPDGTCDIGLCEGSYEAMVEDDEILRLGYLPPAGVDNITVATPGPFTSVNFEVQPFVTLSGHVYDEQSNTLAFGEVQAYLPQSWEWRGGSDANRQGYYEIAVATGSYRVVADHFDGYLGQAYEGYYAWEWDNGPKGDPVDVGSGGVAGIDFYMEAGAFIRGVVTNAGGAPLAAEVRVMEENTGPYGPDWNQLRQTYTEDDGSYEMVVPAGTNYRVRAEAGGYLAEYYDGFYVYQANAATPVATAPGSPAEHIDFGLGETLWIEGRVHTAGTALEDVEVRVEWLRSEEEWWDIEFIADGHSDSNGYYAVPCPPGSNFVVRAVPSPASFYVPEYWSNSYDAAEQARVIVPPGGGATDIDFDLVQGGRIEGNLYALNGVDPYLGGWLDATPLGNEMWFGGNNEDGQYQITVPAGTYLVQFDDDDWPRQYYDGVFASQRDSATVVTVDVGQVTGNIDFTMLSAVRIEGRVTHAGTPVGDMFVAADTVLDTNDWWEIDFADGTATDGDGYYSLHVAPHTDYIVSARPETGHLLQQYWSNTVNQQDATRLALGTTDVSGIDFALTEGMRIEGIVTYEDDAPAADIWVQADYYDTNGWTYSYGYGDTASDGFYSMALPTGRVYAVNAGGDPSTWYPKRYYNNAAAMMDADFLGTNAGATISGIDIQLVPGFRVQGHIYRSDGVTPADRPHAEADSPTGDWILSSFDGDSNGWYEFIAPSGVALLIEGHGDGYVNEYYDNAYAIPDATPIVGTPRSTTTIDFSLYGHSEDSDADGVPDHQEDTRPDGIYVPGQDATSATNADTDGDSHTDYEEIAVLLTDPTDASSCLRCVGVGPDGSGGLRVTWSSVPGHGPYWIESCPAILTPVSQWEATDGPFTGSPSNTTSAVLAGPANSNVFYRLNVVSGAVP